MINRIPSPNSDDTYSSCAYAGGFIFLSHHAGGFDQRNIRHQMRATFDSVKQTLAAVGASMNDIVQIHLYLRNLSDFDEAREVFYEYFDTGCFPPRMTSTSDFLDDNCLCMIDGIAYKMQS
ncbi:hypothetical protein FACS1894184_10310 [Clostridia bacterium]|nr:hypothetical protein FACS1894184_10310 [Clostridia bacterium]